MSLKRARLIHSNLNLRCSGEVWRAHKVEHDITTRELGKILGIDHSVAARILKGERAIKVEHAKSLGAWSKMDSKAFLEL